MKFQISEFCLLSHKLPNNFNIIYAPKYAKPNLREPCSSHGGHTLKGLTYEKTSVFLWISLKGRGDCAKAANHRGGHYPSPEACVGDP